MNLKTSGMALAVSLFALASAQASDGDRHEAQAISRAKFSLSEAIHLAERQGNGQAISAEYEFNRGNRAYYEVKVLRDDGRKLTQYRLSPDTGRVQEASDEEFEKLFTRLKPASLQNAPTSLSRAISTAEARSGGKATEAEVDRDGDQVKYTVKVVKLDGTSEKVKVNGADGKVASAD
ncbi:MAG TPA: PepSY domain-containing protein [Steroidobacteraceae bacterium]|nr:PepSY domain-containing protein [Steroidobacteraceae bacterium]